MSLKDTSVLVTGATGFIGKHLVNALLKQEANVSVICRKKAKDIPNKLKSYEGDLLDAGFVSSAIRKIAPKKIFHLAAFTNPSRHPTLLGEAFKVNFQGTVNLLNSLKNADYESFVFSSTAEVYGSNKVPFKESMMLRPMSPYSLSKASAEMYCNMVHETYGCPVTILRLFLPYGPMQSTNRFVPQLITSLLENRQFNMTKGEQKRDFIFVGDVVNAFIRAASAKKANGEAINICSGRQYKIKDIADKASNILNSHNLISHSLPYRENEQWNYFGSIAKAGKILNWRPKTSIDFGLKKTIAWYRLNYK